MNARQNGKKVILLGDLNSHRNGWCWTKATDSGGLEMEAVVRTFDLRVHNNREQWTCVRKVANGANGNRQQNVLNNGFSYTLID